MRNLFNRRERVPNLSFRVSFGGMDDAMCLIIAKNG
jgi:hypothetical protein